MVLQPEMLQVVQCSHLTCGKKEVQKDVQNQILHQHSSPFSEELPTPYTMLLFIVVTIYSNL